MRSPKFWFLVAISVLLPWHIAMVAGDPWFRLPPKPAGDGPDYENIAYHLSRGEGWSLDWTDPLWRAPYVAADVRTAALQGDEVDGMSVYAVQLARGDGLAPTTGRPPLFPAIVAAIYWMVERGPTAFACVRLFLAACLAFAGAVATALSARIVASTTAKAWPVALAASGTLLLALLDRTVRTYATDFLTEPLALLLLQLWLWCVCELLDLFRTNSSGDDQTTSALRRRALATLSGIVLALMVYTRSIMVLWLPGVWLLIGGAVWFRTAKLYQQPNVAISGRDLRRQNFLLATRMMVVCVLICAPWWIRNCIVLKTWMPLGTQGPITLLGGYSDEALTHRGEWQSEPERRLRESAEHELILIDDRSIPQREVRIARQASQQVRQWAGEHLADLPRLAMMRVESEWNPYTGRALVWKLLALVGLCWLVIYVPRAAWLLGGILLLNTLCVMLLYSVGGRFLVPLYGILYTLAGIGLTSVATGALHLVTRFLST